MTEWQQQLRTVVGEWGLSPEEQAGIVDELEQHLEQELDELTPRIGESAALAKIIAQVNDPALRAASVRPTHEPTASVQHSRSRAAGWSALLRDVRYGWRALRRSPGTSAMAAVALALGIGLTTVMFTIVYSLLLRGLPFEKADDIAMIMHANPSAGESELALSMHEFFVYRDAQQSFETFGAWTPTTINLSGDEQPDRLDAVRLTATALQVPGVRPVLGRTLTPADENPNGELVIVLSHLLWRDRYASDSTVIGRIVRINGLPATVVGVMPEGFRYPRESKIWIPLRLNPANVPWGSGVQLNGVGRLRHGVSLRQASAEFIGISQRIEADHAETNKGVRAVIQPFVRATIPLAVYSLLYAMFGAVALVFLVACTNVANLLLARAAHRAKEVAVRIALGATRLAIARQFLVESALLAGLSACLAVPLAWVGMAAFREAIAGQAPFWVDFQLHPQVFLFIAAAALGASMLSGLLPAFTASRSQITDVLKDQALGSSSLRSGKLSRGLVVFQLVLSSALLVVAALMSRSIMNLHSVEPGFRTAGVLTGRVTLTGRDSLKNARFFERLSTEVSRLPGARATSLSSNVPGPGWSAPAIAIEGTTYPRENSYPSVRHLTVTPGFFETFDVGVSRGRAIGTADRPGSVPVAVVNQRFVDRFFPDRDAIGHRLNLTPGDSVANWVTIVGVIPNLYASDRGSVNNNAAWPAEVLTSFMQRPATTATIAIRTEGDPGVLVQPLRALVSSMDADLPVYALAEMDDLLRQSRWEFSVFGGLFVVFGIVALILASIGLYAVLAFTVSRREREMGIRMALGAAAFDVVRLVLKGGAVLLGIGVSIGLALGIGAAQLAAVALYEVKPTDPMVLAVVVGTLALTGLIACLGPALRATKSDPVRSLRAE